MIEKLKQRAARTLRWSEKYTKTDMLYLTKGGFWLTVTKVFALIASFATSIAFANLLPEATYGVYRYILAFLPILVIPTLAGMDTALTRAIAQEHPSTFHPAFALKVRWGLLGGLGSLLLAGYYYFNGNETLSLAFLIAAPFIPIMDPLQLYVAYLNGRKEFRSQAYVQTTVRAVAAIALVGTVFLTQNVLIIISTYFISYSALRAIFFFTTSRKISRSDSVDKSALGFGKHLSLMSMLGVLSTSLDKILVFHFAGAAALAGYYLALIPYKHVRHSLSSLTTLALPKFSESNPETIRNTLPQKILRLYVIIIPIVIAYALVGPFLFIFIYPKYEEFVLLSVLFMIMLIFFPISFLQTAMTARGEKTKLYISTVSHAITRIVLLLALMPLYGIWGAAAAIVISQALGSTLILYLFFRR